MTKQCIFAGIIILIIGPTINVSALSLEFTDAVSGGFSQPFVSTDENPTLDYRHNMLDDASAGTIDGIKHWCILFWLSSDVVWGLTYLLSLLH